MALGLALVGCATPQYEEINHSNLKPVQPDETAVQPNQTPAQPEYQDISHLDLKSAKPDKEPAQPEQTLREGDVLNISFPGAPNLNTVQQIRRDGKITMSLVGDVTAAGLTPNELQKKLVGLYASQLVDKEVTVIVQSSSFPIFVTGAVLRPGKILANRPMTALEAIMEAGGFDYTRANLKAVTVIRNDNGRMQHFKLNLKRVLEGNGTETFKLKPSDIVYVPEKFQWF